MCMPARVVVKLDTEAFLTVLRGPNGPVMRDLLQRGNRVLSAAVRACPVDQGALRASLHMDSARINGDLAVRVGSNLPYAIFVHEGTGIYGKGSPIRPVRAKVLRWPNRNNSGVGRRRYKAGKTASYVYAREVRGTPGRPFLRQALQAAR